MKNKISTTEKLIKFVNQRAGLEFANYGDVKAYRAESREITKDRNDFFELLSVAQTRIGKWEKGKFVSDLDIKLTFNLKKSNGRLTLNDKDELEYCTGQYFPTEYRPAACRVLAQLIWNDYMSEEKPNEPNPVYKDGHEIRRALKMRGLSRRVMNGYFN
jgi:hypothetical protein